MIGVEQNNLKNNGSNKYYEMGIVTLYHNIVYELLVFGWLIFMAYQRFKVIYAISCLHTHNIIFYI